MACRAKLWAAVSALMDRSKRVAQKKRGLGRGLDALIEARSSTDDAGKVAELDIEWIEPNPFQPRSELDEAELESLADSIRENGDI
jgi:ParB family transcriptional regulator, chromosome partitioning protein